MKITVLSDIEKDGERDDVIDQVADALRQNRHSVSSLVVDDDIKKLVGGLFREKADRIANLRESLGENIQGDVGIGGLLQVINISYTGSGGGELLLQPDTSMT